LAQEVATNDRVLSVVQSFRVAQCVLRPFGTPCRMAALHFSRYRQHFELLCGCFVLWLREVKYRSLPHLKSDGG